MKSPCMNCNNRVIGCHIDCLKYSKWVNTRQEQRKKARFEQSIVTYLCDRSKRVNDYKKGKLRFHRNSK